MKRYYQHRKAEKGLQVCVFCADKIKDEIIYETPLAYVVPNQTFYDLWEGRTVVDHLMVIPKRHMTTLGELQPDESVEIMQIIGRYEAEGYNVYARGVDSVSRSQSHQHTHLIKTAHEKPKGIFYIEKPYVVVKF